MSEHNYDLLIVGGGPAGLAAATSAGYERLKTGLVDEHELGGQAGTSSLIENYAGFDTGITGPKLAFRMIRQARRLGADLHVPVRITAIEPGPEGFQVRDDAYELYAARSVLIASGVQYTRHDAENIPELLNRGVFYGSPNLAASYTDQQLFVVGGANSAGQAARRLAECEGCTVHLLVRGSSIADKMSGHLTEMIEATENIEVHTRTDLIKVDGEEQLEAITVADTANGDRRQMAAHQLFLLIGAKPKTTWLPERVHRDDYKFVVAGRDLGENMREEFEKHCGRQPFDHETSIPGLFVAGDVRSNSVKRVASAAAEGTEAVSEIDKHLGNVAAHRYEARQ